jgi:phenylacetate-CoA ligase
MLPVVARSLFRLQERLLGRPTFAIARQLEESQWWPREAMRELQLERLTQIVRSAYDNSSYWREVFNRSGFTPADIRSLEDLRRFPLLDKDTIRTHRESMVHRHGSRVTLVRTSGSTNEALQFYTNSFREAQINAARMRGHRSIGIERGEREMYFWGCPIELKKQDRIKAWRDWLINDGLTNGFYLTPELVAGHLRAWSRWRPACIFGYPNSLSLFTLFAQQAGMDLSVLKKRGLKVICTTSEMLTDADRAAISAGFGVPVYDSYGLREGGLVGHECAHSTMHVVDEQLILETINPHSLQTTDGEGELVITNLVSTVMPMIRYRTGDLVKLSTKGCACGRKLSSVAIDGGRVAEFIVTSAGTWIPGYAFIYICRGMAGIDRFQVRQERSGEIRFLLVVNREFPANGRETVEAQTRQCLKCDDRVIVEVVDRIEPAPSGKHRTVVSRVAEELLCK